MHIFDAVNIDHSKRREVQKIIVRPLKHHLPPRSLQLLHPTSRNRKGSPLAPQPQPSASADHSPLLQPSPAGLAGAGKPLNEGQRNSCSLSPSAVLMPVLLSSELVSRFVPWHFLFYYFKETGLLNAVLHSHWNTPFPFSIRSTGIVGIV